MPLPDELILGVGTGAGQAAAGNHDHAVAYDRLDPDWLTTGEETIPRGSVLGTPSMTSGSLRLCYFTARKTEAITQVRLSSGGTAAGATPTLVRAGVWTTDAAGALLAMVASIANDTALFAAPSTAYVKALEATWNKVEGTRYAFGLIVVTSFTAPTVPAGATVINSTDAVLGPRMSAVVTGLTDLPASVVAGSLVATNARPFAVFLP